MNDNVSVENEIGVSDTDIIEELRKTIKSYRTKKPVTVAGMIDTIISKEFAVSDDKKYSNAIWKIKEHINNITNKCSLKYTKRVIIVSAVLDELDGR